MRVAIGGLSHETNVFSPVKTPLSAWRILQNQELIDVSKGKKTNIGGILEIAEAENWQIVPTLYAGATPSAPTDQAAYATLKQKLLGKLAKEEVDAVILCMHGAMMAEGVDDPEGDLVTEVRRLIGNKPLIVTLDLHGNNTEQMALSCDAIFGFDTNPHIDSYERALEASRCLASIFNQGVIPVTAFQRVKMLPPTINMRTAEGPMLELFELARQWEKRSGMINVSVFGGFPFCDVNYAGFNVIATADGDRLLAQKACDDICQRAWQIREQFLKELPQVEAALDLAEQALSENPTKPIVLADVADNPGGGGSGDTTELLAGMIERNLVGSAAALIWDPESVDQAFEVGVGKRAIFKIGGKAEPKYGPPIEVEAKVKSLSDGEFIATGPMSRGNTMNIGLAARLEIGNVQVLLSQRRTACNDADIYRNLGIDPAQQRLLLVKSRGHFRASFEPLASKIIEVDAPGAANPNLHRFEYKNIDYWPLNKA